MSFKSMLEGDSMRLIVSLPKNDIAFAKAAWENGADAIKIHLNVGHFASGSSYGSLEEEMQNISDILKLSPVPVGVVLGEGTQKILNDIEAISKEKFSFMSVYYDHAPLEILNFNSMVKTVAINPYYDMKSLSYFKSVGIEAIEMSIMGHDQYGSLLTIKDLVTYKTIIDVCKLPVILPTQKRIRVNDIEHLKKIGVKILMIGAVVTGTSIDGYGFVVAEYANEIHH